jgi:hypothetical protein
MEDVATERKIAHRASANLHRVWYNSDRRCDRSPSAESGAGSSSPWRPRDFLRIDNLVCQFREIAKGMNVNGYDGKDASTSPNARIRAISPVGSLSSTWVACTTLPTHSGTGIVSRFNEAPIAFTPCAAKKNPLRPTTEPPHQAVYASYENHYYFASSLLFVPR